MSWSVVRVKSFSKAKVSPRSPGVNRQLVVQAPRRSSPQSKEDQTEQTSDLCWPTAAAGNVHGYIYQSSPPFEHIPLPGSSFASHAHLRRTRPEALENNINFCR